jgi:hypothetical protein
MRILSLTLINVLLFVLLLITSLWIIRLAHLEFYSSGGMELSVVHSAILAVPFFVAILILKQKSGLLIFRWLVIPISPFLFYLCIVGGDVNVIHLKFVLFSLVFVVSVFIVNSWLNSRT